MLVCRGTGYDVASKLLGGYPANAWLMFTKTGLVVLGLPFKPTEAGVPPRRITETLVEFQVSHQV